MRSKKESYRKRMNEARKYRWHKPNVLIKTENCDEDSSLAYQSKNYDDNGSGGEGEGEVQVKIESEVGFEDVGSSVNNVNNVGWDESVMVREEGNSLEDGDGHGGGGEAYHNKKEAISSGRRHPKSRNRCRCLLCFKKAVIVKKVDNLEANTNVIFIMKKMLSVSNDKMTDYLENVGDPGKWINFCKDCNGLVEEAIKLHRKIQRLEECLKKCQDGMIRKIKTTWKFGEEEKTFKKERVVLEESHRPTVETRELVGRFLTPDSHIFFNGNNDADWGEELNLNHEDDDEGQSTKEADEEKTDKEEVDKLHGGQYKCHLCPHLKEMSLNNLADHVMFHYRRPLQCSECSTYYSSADDLINLRRTTDETEASHVCSGDTLIGRKFSSVGISFWGCGQCPEKFDKEDDRDSHENGAHLSSNCDPLVKTHNAHKCSSCSKSYKYLSQWRLHQVIEHPEVAKFSCKYCDKSFKSQTSKGIDFCDEEKLLEHMKKEHQSLKATPFALTKLPDECEFCGAFFTSYLTLNKHLVEYHSLPIAESYKCPVCSARKSERKLLYKHLNNHHLQERRIDAHCCDLCGYTRKVNNDAEFAEHRFSMHGVIPEGRPILSCSEEEGCTFQCVDWKKMRRHLMKEHEKERKHKCKICGKGFLNSTHLRGHEQIHKNKGLKPFQCEICGNSFAVRNYLYIHMRLSHQNRPFASTHKKKAPKRKKEAVKCAVDAEAENSMDYETTTVEDNPRNVNS